MSDVLKVLKIAPAVRRLFQRFIPSGPQMLRAKCKIKILIPFAYRISKNAVSAQLLILSVGQAGVFICNFLHEHLVQWESGWPSGYLSGLPPLRAGVQF